jgi:hypothetical protein
MIHYQLRCADNHEFDGWFKDSGNFERQAKRGLIACPVCANTAVDRALMAPRLARKNRAASPVIDHDTQAESHAETHSETPTEAPAPPPLAAGGVLPDQVRAVLTKLRAEVEKNCDYVGRDFATLARKIHNGEAEPRGIYGETTDDEAESLAEDGIDIARIPWLPRTDS